MDLIGKRVNYKSSKEGTITDVSASEKATYITVAFSDSEAVKFVYPDCFNGFLSFIDEKDTVEVKENLKQQREKEEREKAAEIEKIRERLQTLQKQTKNGRSIKPQKSIFVRPFATVKDFCEEYKKALTAEIIYLKKTGGKRERVFGGKRIQSRNGRYIYSFETEDEFNYPEGTLISIWHGQESYSGYVLACEEFTIIIATETNFGDDVRLLEISAEPWRLLEALCNRLDDVMGGPSAIVKELVCDGVKNIDYGDRAISSGQQIAVKMSKTQPITFIWGPPGAGKTQALANIALKHMEQGNRVLVLSYSNVSVDGAIMRLYKMRPTVKPGSVVRYGYAKHKELLEHKYLTSYNLVIHQHPELLAEQRTLVAEGKKLPKGSQRYVQIRSRLTQIKKKLAVEEKEAVKNASFVATTVSKAIIDSAIREGLFDVVIFDEASMAYIPQIVFSASIAKKNFICMGDFRQLPPIVQSSSDSILNADIFQYCGISSAVDDGRSHNWLCMLDTQYRMHPRIADFSSRSMYGGLLRSASEMEEKRRNIIEQAPAAGYAVAFADLSGMMSVCTKTANGSRVNVLSAMISFSLALEAARNNEVGIITPYYAQSRLLRAMARDAADMGAELKTITCATVHQFQGSEKDVIIYDAVDCYRMPYPGMLLASTNNSYANRLFNVALTRAKGKFIGVANIDYMNNKNLSSSLMFEHMIRSQRGKQSCMSGMSLYRKRATANISFFDSDNGVRRFIEDIENARSEIRIDIPDRPKGQALEEMVAALRRAKERGTKVYIRAEKKQSIPRELRSLAIENSYVANPVAIVDKKLVWFGLPDSAAEFKSEGSVIQTKYRPIIRFEGAQTARAIYGLIEMDKTEDHCEELDRDEDGKAITETFASYVLANKKCSACGKTMRLRKGKGRFFFGCSGYPVCKNTNFVDVYFVEKYFHRNGGVGQRCPKCGFSLEAREGKYGVYIQCCGSQRHKYKFDEV